MPTAITLDKTGMRRLALGIVLLVFLFEVYVVGVNYSNYLVYVVEAEPPFLSALAVASMLFSFYVFYRLVLVGLGSPWFYRALIFVMVAIAALVEYGYVKALGRFTDKADIETAIATTPEQKSAALAMYFEPTALLMIVMVAVAFVAIRSVNPRGIRDLLLLMLLVTASFAAFPVIVDKPFPTVSTNAFLRTSIDFLVNGPLVTGNFAGNVTGIEFKRREVRRPVLPEGSKPPNNIVVVVDESVGGDHFSINGYGRETTPFLATLEREGLLTNWGVAAAASTGSRFTYASLITGLGPDDFPERTGFKINTFPTIFQYARAMGYRTYFFDGQMNGYWGANDDKNYFDEWQGFLDITENMGFESWDIDNKIARKVRTMIGSSTGNFIFVFKHGSHIPYQGNFPPDAAVWKPSYETANKYDIPKGGQLEAVCNAYDNSIRYNVDSFFKELVSEPANLPNNSIVIYTGDHGQTLFANGRSSHGGNTKEEASVPLLIVGKMPAQPDTRYRASHGNIFPTVLDLIGYPQEMREAARFPSLLKAKATDTRQRFFNPDLGAKVPFD